MEPAGPSAGSAALAVLERAVPALGLFAVVALLARLAAQAAAGAFATDECFHAYASRWLLEHRSLPFDFPALYSGFYYYYPPLFHVVGALWMALLGADALHLLPVALYAALLAALAGGALGAVPLRAGRWAALLCALSLTLATYAVLLYVDELAALVFTLATALLIRLRATGRWRDAVALGLVAGLAVLTKFTGAGLVGLLLVVAAALGLRGERRIAARVAVAAALAVLVAAPWLIRNQALYGSALYPAGAPDMDRALYALNRARFSTPPLEFLGLLPGILGPWLGAVVAVALGAAAWRRRFALREGVMLAALGGMLATAFVPMGAERHLTPFLAMLALTGAWALADLLAGRRGWTLAVEAALVALALHAAWTLPDLRGPADLPEELAEAFPQVAAHTPPDARLLSLWTYDTFYYTGRAATWPNPWGQRGHPVAMFRDSTADDCLAHLRASGIDYVLAPRTGGASAFDSANYPQRFLRCLGELVARDSTRLVWTSETLALVRVAAAPAAR